MISKNITETDVIKSITDYLGYMGIFHLRLNSGKMFAQYGDKKRVVHLCPVGTPDLFSIVNGRPIFFEVKKDEKEKEKWLRRVARFKKTAIINSYEHREVMQYKSMMKIQKCGAEVYLVCSVDEVENIIKNTCK